jgi:hypothetical protein
MNVSIVKKTAALLTVGFMLAFYQNCSQVAPKVTASTDPAMKASSDVVIATDEQGNILPVDTDSTAGVVDGKKDDCPDCVKVDGDKEYVKEEDDKDYAKDDKEYADDDKDEDKKYAEKEEYKHGKKSDYAGKEKGECKKIKSDSDLVQICGMDSKTIHNIVDVAQFKNQDVNLDLIKGKTLIYSSDSEVVLKSLNIVEAVGRTIICGVKVDKLQVKKGRLEVKESEIKEIGEQHGVIVKDQASLLPAGY